MEEKHLHQFHPHLIAVLADLYGIGCPRLTRKQVRAKYRLTYARLDWVVARALIILEHNHEERASLIC